jgi:2-C-methyl-D-erythritol 4-phosphate cytidylyltransferase
MDFSAVVVAPGRCWDRRAGAVDPLTPLGGVPMVVWAVRSLLAGLSGVVGTDRVVLLAPADRHAALTRACAGLPVEVRETLSSHAQPLWAQPSWAHAGQRSGTPAGFAPVRNPVLLVHDALRPLAPPALVARVVAELVGTGCAAVVPVLPLTDTVKLVDADDLITATPDRAGLRVLQTPLAVRSELVGPGADPIEAVPALAVEHPVRSVEGDPLAFPVHSAWDLELAELLVVTAEEER